VLKCIYQFAEPERWDVVVFKNPLEPSINYIKRLIAKPGETLEIIDGDIYIDNRIARKPEKVQRELWMPVFNNDYQPVRPAEPSFNFHTWRQPFVNVAGSQWENSRPRDPTRFYLDSSGRQIHLLRYDTDTGNPLRATSGYNNVRRYENHPFVSDLMIRFYAEIRSDNKGIIGADLEKYGITYTGIVDQTGRMRIYENNGSRQRELAAKTIEPPLTGQPVLFRFKNVDHKLALEFAGEELTYDLGRTADSLNYRNNSSEPAVRIRGSGELVLSHIALYRDIHYMSRRYLNGRNVARAGQGNPFTLGQDEYFMLGDNSPSSQDSRWWNKQGIGNRGKLYRKGVVPREYLVGKALWVYWPSGYKPWRNFPVGIIPNVGDMKLIYGGIGPEDADKPDD
jgi:signal peptidase I